MRIKSALLVMLLVAGISAPANAKELERLDGDWRNPAGTVVVHVHACNGDKVCAAVIRASAQAAADAREGGTPNLIGTELLRNYTATGRGRWEGRVFVPDEAETFFSRIHRLDQQSIRISGCILGGLLCKSQVWLRTN
ncbi:MAG: hypothetical protein RLZZ08_1243 [Pseudomonadota bacterium]|jgi:uncharacterized protein (DUF2147 family)